MKNLIGTLSEIELLKNQIEAEELRYKTAIGSNKNYFLKTDKK